jgi:uncharacterized protein
MLREVKMAIKFNSIYAKADKAIRKCLGNVPDIEFTHGLLTGVLCNPDIVPPGIWLDYLLKINKAEFGSGFRSSEEAEELSIALIELYNSVNESLRNGSFEPLISPDIELVDFKTTENWCRGFIFASDSWPETARLKPSVNGHILTIDYFSIQSNPKLSLSDKTILEKLDRSIKDKRENIKNNTIGIYNELGVDSEINFFTDDSKPKYTDVYEEMQDVLSEYDVKLEKEYLNGYLTAIACTPSLIADIDWFEPLFCSSENTKGADWGDEFDRIGAMDSFNRAIEDIEDSILDEKYVPLLNVRSSRKKIESWRDGFLNGVYYWDSAITHSDDVLKGEVNKILSSGKDLFNILPVSIHKIFVRSKLKTDVRYKFLNDALKMIPDCDIKPEFVHGFVCAIVCSPVKIEADKWIAKLFEAYKEKFLNSSDLGIDIWDNMKRFRVTIIEESGEMDLYPQIYGDSMSWADSVQVWAEGFIKGSEFWKDKIIKNKQYMSEYLPILYFARNCVVEDDFFKGFEEVWGRMQEDVIPVRIIYWSLVELDDCRDRFCIEMNRSKSAVGRNDPCPCGSGKKYKKCCGK